MSFSVDIPPFNSKEIISFPQFPDPEISIVVLLTRQKDVTLSCLRSISDICAAHPYEILLVDSLPESDSRAVCNKIVGARIIRTDEGLSAAEAWNIGSKSASGRYLVFLAGDIFPMPGWLDELVRTVKDLPEAGFVGSQLISSKGVVWEGGAMVDDSGEICHMGAGSHPFNPDFSYQCEVDFCNAISFVIPKKVFMDAGGIPNNMNDDFTRAGMQVSSALRSMGKKVFYNPLSKVLILSNSRAHTGMVDKKKQLLQKLFRKDNNRIEDLSDKYYPSGSILVIDIRTPTPDQDSGSQDLISFFSIFQSIGFKITFIPAADFSYMTKYTADLQRMGVRCLYAPFSRGIDGFLKTNGREFCAVFLYKVHCAAYYMDMIRYYCPNAKIVFNTVDLHFVREQRQALIENSASLYDKAQQTKQLELSVVRNADCTIVLSTEERALLLKESDITDEKIAVIPLIREIPGRKTGFLKRNNMLFVGGFEHQPNVDAMLFFVNSIWPRIKSYLPDILFYIIGSKPPAEILELAGNDIVVTGYLSDISKYFNECRLSVAPLRYGAGLKGKVVTSLSHGLPCVATSTAVEGSGLVPEEHVLVADDPDSFALAVDRLYRNEMLWNAMSDNGLAYMQDHFSFDAGKRNLRNLLERLGILKEEGKMKFSQ